MNSISYFEVWSLAAGCNQRAKWTDDLVKSFSPAGLSENEPHNLIHQHQNNVSWKQCRACSHEDGFRWKPVKFLRHFVFVFTQRLFQEAVSGGWWLWKRRHKCWNTSCLSGKKRHFALGRLTSCFITASFHHRCADGKQTAPVCVSDKVSKSRLHVCTENTHVLFVGCFSPEGEFKAKPLRIFIYWCAVCCISHQFALKTGRVSS